jgi:hypothetical protein
VGPSIIVPLRFDDGSEIRCKQCGKMLGTWAELKERARRAILAAGHISVDPLSLDACQREGRAL